MLICMSVWNRQTPKSNALWICPCCDIIRHVCLPVRSRHRLHKFCQYDGATKRIWCRGRLNDLFKRSSLFQVFTSSIILNRVNKREPRALICWPRQFTWRCMRLFGALFRHRDRHLCFALRRQHQVWLWSPAQGPALWVWVWPVHLYWLGHVAHMLLEFVHVFRAQLAEVNH